MPTKAAYLRLETDGELEFEFYLADRLSTTVTAMRDSMPNEEFVFWKIYHQRKAQKQELEALKSKGR